MSAVRQDPEVETSRRLACLSVDLPQLLSSSFGYMMQDCSRCKLCGDPSELGA